MQPREPLPLHHSWPLFALREHLAPILLDEKLARNDDALAERGIGRWHCNLSDDSLTWTGGVYDIFGLERRSRVPRPLAVSLYRPESAAQMERLRAYAIRHRRGFTLDVDISPATGGRYGVRLIAAPVIDERRVVALSGIKQLLSRESAPSAATSPCLFDPPRMTA